jgi:hypothetical protein
VTRRNLADTPAARRSCPITWGGLSGGGIGISRTVAGPGNERHELATAWTTGGRPGRDHGHPSRENSACPLARCRRICLPQVRRARPRPKRRTRAPPTTCSHRHRPPRPVGSRPFAPLTRRFQCDIALRSPGEQPAAPPNAGSGRLAIAEKSCVTPESAPLRGRIASDPHAHRPDTHRSARSGQLPQVHRSDLIADIRLALMDQYKLPWYLSCLLSLIQIWPAWPANEREWWCNPLAACRVAAESPIHECLLAGVSGNGGRGVR